jgi:acetyl-CoA C-acetyltransferase
MSKAITASWQDVWLLDGVRTPFVDYNGALAQISPIDLGIKVAREVFVRAQVSPEDVGTVITGSMAQASFDAYMLPRHIGLYSGVPIEVPAHMVQRVCGTGIEVLMQAADTITHRGVNLALCVGAESMSRNPVAAYTHRSGFRMGQVEFKDFLWEALLDGSANVTMGDTAENLARQYQITRGEVDAYAARSFARAVTAKESGFFAGEIAPVRTEEFAREGYNARGIKLSRETRELDHDTHIRPSSVEQLAKIRPAFGGVQTGGNSSAIVDGAAAALASSGDYAKKHGRAPLARLVTGAVAGVPPEIMGIGPVPAIQAVLEKAGLKLAEIDRFEINEAFGAQVMACARALGLDEDRLNVNGGAIAIGHPLGATGVRLSVTLARELKRANLRYGIASACIGGGQGIALLIENPEARKHNGH